MLLSKKYADVRDTYLQGIFNKALYLVLIECGQFEPKIRLNANLKMMLSSYVVPKQPYEFESIAGMSLKGIRDIRANPNSEREKCLALVDYIRKQGVSVYSGDGK
ncbi:hypothetical protein [Piscirickettsia litoralis]|uniref:Uncharacterized protein n=1 Tax=Piscirickettsia litoralis TaxID=1891921 RepID=A0ABX2ZYB4_9GAMM|nr:hypothetical protein [Piscirickettsia litoralis]ODN41488.1 hypothetical protein BGC07_15350 [Piscirickettsia litoralis]